ncbi:hypothetical protein P7K49_006211 [Saguinus oedipus]|uniref:Uncharacterized protein n=1 Tax=Saguinus oedipus TaxID=9490 RepID=A0ABQ9W294_SAGOE|nr:hypothetical protein P7K49_006211 [Saguinus oedipus]
MEAAVQFLVKNSEVIEAQYKVIYGHLRALRPSRLSTGTTRVSSEGGVLMEHLKSTHFTFQTARPAGALAKGHAGRLGWEQRFHGHCRGAGQPMSLSRPMSSSRKESRCYGSLTRAGTVSLGLDAETQEVFASFNALLTAYGGARRPRFRWPKYLVAEPG